MHGGRCPQLRGMAAPRRAERLPTHSQRRGQLRSPRSWRGTPQHTGQTAPGRPGARSAQQRALFALRIAPASAPAASPHPCSPWLTAAAASERAGRENGPCGQPATPPTKARWPAGPPSIPPGRRCEERPFGWLAGQALGREATSPRRLRGPRAALGPLPSSLRPQPRPTSTRGRQQPRPSPRRHWLQLLPGERKQRVVPTSSAACSPQPPRPPRASGPCPHATSTPPPALASQTCAVACRVPRACARFPQLQRSPPSRQSRRPQP